MRPQIKVQFVDFWKDLNIREMFFFKLLEQHYDFVTSEDPDLVFFSLFGNEHKKYNCPRIAIICENQRAAGLECDFSFGFENTSETHFQMPLFAFFYPLPVKRNITEKLKFCNFIYKSHQAQERIQFCQALSRYKRVDCLGAVLNNVPRGSIGLRNSSSWMDEKVDALSPYKFTIAFENQPANNYITEKIFHPLLVGSIPIYWGAPNITDFINPDSFINVRDFQNYREVVEYVKEVDNNPTLYNQIVNTNPIHSTSKLNNCTEEAIMERFDIIVDTIK